MWNAQQNMKLNYKCINCGYISNFKQFYFSLGWIIHVDKEAPVSWQLNLNGLFVKQD